VNIRPNDSFRLVVVAPVYDDAAAAGQLLENLFRAFSKSDVALHVLLVDDGSPTPLGKQLRPWAEGRVDVLRLRRNVGHQRAIALGTAFVHEHLECDAMLVMDADGEDRPADAVRLADRCREEAGQRIIFAQRTRRTESLLFQGLYRVYQVLHWVFTGIRVRVGNFSIVPASQLPALVTLPALWNHYAAAIYQARLPRESLSAPRGTRYSGRSKMNLVALVMHGLQAISVFLDVVLVRLLLSICFIACCSGVVLVATLAARLFANTTAPLWTPLAAGGLLVLVLCLTLGGLALALGSLAGRKSLDFIPIRDYRFFIEAVQSLSPAGESALASKVLLLKEDSFQLTAEGMALAAPSAAQL
jgi:polyisoprenyl-phosphate glycosyltransferase